MARRKRHSSVRHAGRVIPVTGDCFAECAEYVLRAAMLGRDAGGRDLVLVHGEVAGRGLLEGLTFSHAWVEDGDEVIDVAKDVRMPRHLYYALGGIDQIGNMYRYTAEQINSLGAATGHWGPWELATSTGL